MHMPMVMVCRRRSASASASCFVIRATSYYRARHSHVSVLRTFATVPLCACLSNNRSLSRVVHERKSFGGRDFPTS